MDRHRGPTVRGKRAGHVSHGERAAGKARRPGAPKRGEGSSNVGGTLPIELVDTANVPGGGQLQLLQCGKEFSIQFGSDELMGSQDHISEMALATMTVERLVRRDGHVLVGGLGMGFTLRAVLEAWASSARVMVAELVPEILTWARGPLAHLFGEELDDPRLTLRIIDVHRAIADRPDQFDAILLDVDNGPNGFITRAYDRLYSAEGLLAAFAALRSGGILSIWSSYRDDDFARRLEAAGFSVDEVVMPAYVGSTDRWHNIWFAQKLATRAVPTEQASLPRQALAVAPAA